MIPMPEEDRGEVMREIERDSQDEWIPWDENNQFVSDTNDSGDDE